MPRQACNQAGLDPQQSRCRHQWYKRIYSEQIRGVELQPGAGVYFNDQAGLDSQQSRCRYKCVYRRMETLPDCTFLNVLPSALVSNSAI